MKRTRVILSAIFEERKLVCIFLVIFFFPLSLSIGARATLAKFWHSAHPSRFSFYQPVKGKIQKNLHPLILLKKTLQNKFRKDLGLSIN